MTTALLWAVAALLAYLLWQLVVTVVCAALRRPTHTH